MIVINHFAASQSSNIVLTSNIRTVDLKTLAGLAYPSIGNAVRKTFQQNSTQNTENLLKNLDLNIPVFEEGSNSHYLSP